MSAIVCVPKYAQLGQGFTKQEKLQSAEHPGRRTDGRQSPAHWISCLTELKKSILLCPFCLHKFNPRKHHYRRYYSPDFTGKTDGFTVNGLCDACKQHTAHFRGGGTMFVHEETYGLVCIDPVEARRKARQRWAGPSAWQRVKQMIRGS